MQIKRVPIESVEAFSSDYPGEPNDRDAGIEYFLAKFMQRNTTHEEVSIITNITSVSIIVTTTIHIDFVLVTLFHRILLSIFNNMKYIVQIFHHVTCATDQSSINVVFNACKSVIIRRTLENTGFVS